MLRDQLHVLRNVAETQEDHVLRIGERGSHRIEVSVVLSLLGKGADIIGNRQQGGMPAISKSDSRLRILPFQMPKRPIGMIDAKFSA